MTNIEKNTEWLFWIFESFSTKLNWLMDKVTQWVSWFLDKIFEKLGIQQQKETDEVVDDTILNLEELKNDIKTDFELNETLTAQEKEIIEDILSKNEELKDSFDWVKDELWDNFYKNEQQLFLQEIEKITNDDKIEKTEIEQISKTFQQNVEKIKKDEKLKNFIENFSEQPTDSKKIYSIWDIIQIYQTIVDSWQEFTRELLLQKIEEFNNKEK